MSQNLKVSPLLFNPLYWHIKEAFNDPNIFIILITGGSDAAKTYSLAQYMCFDTFGKSQNTIIFRKESTSIVDSVFADFKTIGEKINKAIGIGHFQYYVNKVQAGGCRIRFRGLDDSEKVKGLAAYKYVFMNEVSSFELGEYSEIKRRLRGQPGQKIIADWNPIDENHWLKTEVIDKEEWVDMPLTAPCPKGAISQLDPEFSTKQLSKDGKMLFIKTTYRDNFWCTGHPDGKHGYRDDNQLDNFEKMRINEPVYYNIYGLGNWGKLVTGGEFYKKFKSDKNCQVIDYNKDLPLHLTIDFNVVPAMHATVWQMDGRKTWQISELVTPEPNNNSQGICREFIRLFASHKSGLFIYGDPSGRNRSTRQEEGKNDYTIILEELKRFHPSLRVGFSHPSVSMRGNFINSIFESNIQGIEIWINPKCNKTVQDFMYTRQNADGSKYKEKVKDPKTKVYYEKYGHCFDGRMLVDTFEGKKEIKRIKKGDFVLTRYGYSKVLKLWENGIKKLHKVVVENKKEIHTFYSTDSHEVYTLELGFIAINKLDSKKEYKFKNKKGFFKGRITLDEFYYEAETFDLSVEDNHEYFVNEILVHNCSDGVDYFICEAFKKEYDKYQGLNNFQPGMLKQVLRRPKWTL